MPGLGTRVLDHGGHCDRLPDDSGTQRAQGGLQARAEERVRGVADPQPGRFRLGEQLLAAGRVERERLLAVHVLSGPQRGERHRGVRGGDGQVDHQFDLGDGEHIRHAAADRYAVLVSDRRGSAQVEVRDGEHPHVRECRQVPEVLVADHSGADDRDADRPARHASPPSAPRPARSVR